MLRRLDNAEDVQPENDPGPPAGKAMGRIRRNSAVEGSGTGFFDWVTQLVHQHRARLVRLVRREGLGAEDALDCVQDAFYGFLTLPQARSLVEEPDDSAKLLTVLARNVARNRRRRHDRSRPHLSDGITLDALPATAPSADQIVAEAQEYALVVGCMATLNQIQRAVVTLRLLDEVPGENVARMLGTSASNVAVLLSRAKQRLRSCYADSERSAAERVSPRKRPTI
jgi:RNA polymerase sigma-70 factor (ECF subfamily)